MSKPEYRDNLGRISSNVSDEVISVIVAVCLYSTGHLIGGTVCLLVTLLVYLRDKRWESRPRMFWAKAERSDQERRNKPCIGGVMDNLDMSWSPS